MKETPSPQAQDSLSILHASSNRYYWKGTGALSIKTFRNGRAYYHAGHGHFAVQDGSYLLLNQGQEYSITIEADMPVESFCIFFPDRMVEEVYRTMSGTNEQLLDDPFLSNATAVDFVEKTYCNDALLAPALFQLRVEYAEKRNDPIWLEDKLHELSQKLLQVHRQVREEMAKLQSLKASTREELFRRVHIGQDYIRAYSHQSITLGDIASAACLSPNHFLRSYKQLFGRSPHQFLTEIRLQEAKRLLLGTDQPVTEICLAVGFQSPSTFSRLFSSRFTLSPARFRQKSDFE